MNRAEWQNVVAQARQMYGQGTPKSEIYNQLSAGIDKPVRVARIVAALPNPVSVEIYKGDNIFLTILVLLLALFAGFSKFEQVAILTPFPAAPFVAAVFIGVTYGCFFGAVAWGIWRHNRSAYVVIALLLWIGLFQCLRSGLVVMHVSDFDADQKEFIALLDFFTLPVLFIFMICFTGRLRNNIFSKTGFFGKPKQDKSGAFQFDSAWESKLARAVSQATQKAESQGLKIPRQIAANTIER